jgi:hypothetical protein
MDDKLDASYHKLQKILDCHNESHVMYKKLHKKFDHLTCENESLEQALSERECEYNVMLLKAEHLCNHLAILRSLTWDLDEELHIKQVKGNGKAVPTTPLLHPSPGTS